MVTRWSRDGHAVVTRAGNAIQEHVRVVLLVLEGAAPPGSSAPAPEAAARPGRCAGPAGRGAHQRRGRMAQVDAEGEQYWSAKECVERGWLWPGDF
jgi:hypothetical protein